MNNGVFFSLLLAQGGGTLTPVFGQQGVFYGIGYTPNSESVLSSWIKVSGFTVSGRFFNMAAYCKGVANDTMVLDDGYLYVYSGGTANSTTLSSWGFMHVSSGGVASNTTVRGGGTMIVYEGAVANNVTVHSNTYLIVRSGGSALNVTSMAGANITSSAGAVITYA